MNDGDKPPEDPEDIAARRRLRAWKPPPVPEPEPEEPEDPKEIDTHRLMRSWVPLVLLDAVLVPPLMGRLAEKNWLAAGALGALALLLVPLLIPISRASEIARIAARSLHDPRAVVRASIPALAIFFILLAKQLFIVSDLGFTPGRFLIPMCVTTSLIAGLMVLALPSRLQWPAAIAIDLVVSSIFFMDRIHFAVYGGIPNVARIKDIGALGESSIRAIGIAAMRWRDALFFIDLPLAAFAWTRARGRRARLPFTWALLGTVVTLEAMGFFITHDTGHTEGAFGLRAMFRTLGPLEVHARDTIAFVTRDLLRRGPTKAEQDDLRAELTARADARPPPGPLWGKAKGLNVIVLQVESLGAYPFELSFDGNPVLPRLSELRDESIDFDHAYSEVGYGTTADAFFLTNCSLRAIQDETVYSAYNDRTFRCVPEILRAHGCRTFGMGGYDADFQYTALFNLRNGFERQFTIRDFKPEDIIGIGMSDESFLRQSAPVIEQLPQPFYAFMTTLSSHAPYAEFAEHRFKVDPAISGTMLERYLNALNYTDAAIGEFVDKLRADGLLERSVLVVYGDHWDHAWAQDYPLAAVKLGRAPNDAVEFEEKHHIPLFIRVPHGQSAGRVEMLTEELDIGPTLLALLGIDEPLPATLGRDALRAQQDHVVEFPDGSALDEEHAFLPSPGHEAPDRCFSLPRHQQVELSECGALAETARHELEFSKHIIQRDLLKGFSFNHPK